MVLAAAIATVAVAAIGQASASSGGGVVTASSDDGAGPAPQPATAASQAKYQRLFNRLPIREKRWARETSECESGGNPRAVGGGGIYRGAFQFLRSTWKASPKSPGGDPVVYAYRTQAVVAVALKQRDGAGHWPVCG